MSSDDNNSPPSVERERIPPKDGDFTPPKSTGKSKRSRNYSTSSSSSSESSSDDSDNRHEKSDSEQDNDSQEEANANEVVQDKYQRFDTQSKALKKLKLPSNMERYLSNTFTNFVGDKVL